MVIKQLSIFVENKVGRMAGIMEIIGRVGVDVRALSIADISDFGILRLIVDDPDKALRALIKAGVTVSLTDVLGVGVEDKPGAFAEVVRTISDELINIEYMYSFIGRRESRAFMIMRIEDPVRGAEALARNGITLLSEDDAANI